MQNLYLSDKQIAERYNVGRCTVWRWVKTSDFPPPIKLSAGCTRWHGPTIEQYDAAKLKEVKA